MDTNKLKEEKEGIYIDENNGIKYIKQGEDYIPLVVKGLPAKLEEHNGQNYLVNNFGTYTIEDGRVSTEPLCNNEGILLFFNENGELVITPKNILSIDKNKVTFTNSKIKNKMNFYVTYKY